MQSTRKKTPRRKFEVLVTLVESGPGDHYGEDSNDGKHEGRHRERSSARSLCVELVLGSRVLLGGVRSCILLFVGGCVGALGLQADRSNVKVWNVRKGGTANEWTSLQRHGWQGLCPGCGLQRVAAWSTVN